MKISELKVKLIDFLAASKDFVSLEDVCKFFPDFPSGIIASVLNNLYQNKLIVILNSEEDSYAIDSKAIQKKYKNKILYFDNEEIKPILLIKLPIDSTLNQIEGANEYIKNKTKIPEDYHVIIIANTRDETDVQLLSVTNSTNIELEELKKSIKEEIKKQ